MEDALLLGGHQRGGIGEQGHAQVQVAQFRLREREADERPPPQLARVGSVVTGIAQLRQGGAQSAPPDLRTHVLVRGSAGGDQRASARQWVDLRRGHSWTTGVTRVRPSSRTTNWVGPLPRSGRANRPD